MVGYLNIFTPHLHWMQKGARCCLAAACLVACATQMTNLGAAVPNERVVPVAETISSVVPKTARIFSARRTIGLPVADFTGEPIGKLSDLLIELDTSQVWYVEMSLVQDTIGLLPIKELNSRAPNPGFIVDMPLPRLRDVLSVSTALPSVTRGTLSASKALGLPIVSADGQRVGHREDIVFKLPYKSVEYCVVRFRAGVLGANEMLTFQLDELSVHPNAGRPGHLTLAIGAAELKRRLGYTRGEWAGVYDPEYWLNRQHSRDSK